MGASSGGWREGLDEVDANLVDGFQSGFPIEHRPFRTVGDALGISEMDTLARVARLRERGVIRRFGPVLNPPVIGSSTLAALRVPDDQIGETAKIVNAFPQVNHNYRRDHEWNMWFVVTAEDRGTRDQILNEIEAQTSRQVLNLPMRTDYYIDLEFPVVNRDRLARESVSVTEVSATTVSEEAAGDLTPLEADVLLATQGGFSLSRTPYADVAAAVDVPVDDVLAAVERLLTDGCIKRIGCVVDHVVTGFDSNCMVVWNVPDDELDERGAAAGQVPYVTLCYHRPRRPERDWPYNLFTMIHGREPAAVETKIDELASEYLPFAHERLYSTETFKQTGARYEDLLAGTGTRRE